MPDTSRHGQSESSRSPICLTAETLNDDELDKEDKQLLYDTKKTRFWYRRTVAYIALFGMLALAVAGASSLLSTLRGVSATLSAVVVAYYGAVCRQDRELTEGAISGIVVKARTRRYNGTRLVSGGRSSTPSCRLPLLGPYDAP